MLRLSQPRASLAGAARAHGRVRARHRVPRSTSFSSSSSSSAGGLSLAASVTIGGCAGVASALTGTGGGIILIPVLAKLTKMTQQTINGTQHGAITFSAAVGAATHWQSGACNVPLAVVATIPSIVCARLGVQLAQRIPSKKLSLAVGLAMLASSPIVVTKDSPQLPNLNRAAHPLDLQRYHATENRQQFFTSVRRDLPAFLISNAKYAIVGGLAGFVSGLVGVGGGVLVTAYLTAATSLPQETIIGTSLLSIVPTSASAAYSALRTKTIHVPTAVRLGGSLGLGVLLTSTFVTHEVPEEVLRSILATTVGAAALVMMRRGL
jgi:uncharacterized protein